MRYSRAILINATLVTAISVFSLRSIEFDASLLNLLPAGSGAADDYRLFVERFVRIEQIPVLVRGEDRRTTALFAEALARRLAAQPDVKSVQAGLGPAAWRQMLVRGDLARLLPREAHAAVVERLQPAAIDAAVANARRVLALPGAAGVAPWIAADPLGLIPLLATTLKPADKKITLDPDTGRLTADEGRAILLLVAMKESGFGLEGAQRTAAALEEAERQVRSDTPEPETAGLRLPGTTTSSTSSRLDSPEPAVADLGGVGYGGRAEIETIRESLPAPSGQASGSSAPSWRSVRVQATGAFAHTLEHQAIVKQDLIKYALVASLGVALIFAWGLGSARFLLILLPILLASASVTLAIGSALFGRIDAFSLASTALFLGLGDDAAVHFCARLREELKAGLTMTLALERTLGALGLPIVLGAGTTAIAFVVLGLSPVSAISQLGALSAIGLITVTVASLIVLPAFLAETHPEWLLRTAARPQSCPSLLAGLVRFAERRPRRVFAAWALSLVVTCLGLTRAPIFDGRLGQLLPQTKAELVDAEIGHLFGRGDPDGAVLVVGDTDSGAAPLEAVLETSERVSRVLAESAARGEVSEVAGTAELLPSKKEQARRLDAWQRLPRAAAADRLEARLLESGFAAAAMAPALAALRSVPAPLPAAAIPLPGLEALRALHLSQSQDGRPLAMVAFEPRDRAMLLRLAPELLDALSAPSGPQVLVTGRPLLEEALTRSLGDQARLYLVTLLCTLGLIVFRREKTLRATLVAVAIPLSALAMTLGIFAAFGWALDTISIAVIPVLLGIGIDNVIHALERRRELGDTRQALLASGRAILTSTLTTVVGFGALALSRNPALAGFGLAGGIGLLLCLFQTLLLLPAFLNPLRSASR